MLFGAAGGCCAGSNYRGTFWMLFGAAGGCCAGSNCRAKFWMLFGAAGGCCAGSNCSSGCYLVRLVAVVLVLVVSCIVDLP